MNTHQLPEATLSLSALRRYFALIVPFHLVWEFAHMPLYTLWKTGTPGEILFAAVHCTGGDVLIATGTLLIALLFVGSGWPRTRPARSRVPTIAIVLGLGYTIYSEWLNIVVRAAWAYSQLMPTVPVIGTGLSPLLQWLVVPAAGFWWAHRAPADSLSPSGPNHPGSEARGQLS